MSDIRIALVVEGNTDLIIIEAALRAILSNRSFILTKLQPEELRPSMGAGWCGVLKWCEASGQRHPDSLDTDATLEDFDLLVIHLDVDVAGESYANAGQTVVDIAACKNWGALPCKEACPPVSNSCNRLISVLNTWLTPAKTGNKTVLCLPAQSSGTWLAAATLPDGHRLLNGIECNVDVEASLSQLAMSLRIKKNVRDYRANASHITDQWVSVKTRCTQAGAFEQAILDAI